MPLALGGHMNIVVSRYGITSRAYERMHRWLGRVAVVEGLVHASLATASRTPDLHDSSQVAALVVSGAQAD